MRIVNISLKYIKKFDNEQEYIFDDTASINTISGKNGSGKSTIFESMVLCQKAYFVNEIEHKANALNSRFSIENLKKEVSKELYNIALKNGASIKMCIRFSKTDFQWNMNVEKFTASQKENDIDVFDVHISLAVTDIQEGIAEWKISIDEGTNEGLLGCFWNLQNPSNIIVYLDADKNVYEDDFTYQKISMISEETISPIINFVLESKQIYQNMYNIMMNAYLYQRINPQTPKKDLFFSDSKEMFQQLIDNVTISNFSGKERKDQFILISKNSEKYDTRNMSSGEKLTWYTLLILNYIKKIGILIIDEPENHLHEQLAWKFIGFLKYIIRKSVNNLTIGQVFLVTHAKNIIYNNFSDGKNYVLDNDGNMLLIEKDKCEDILRECGISYVDDRILFIEGRTESDNLKTLCDNNNIRIRELANCAEIIQVYKSLVKVKELVYAPKFVFMIDKDTRDDDDIEAIRKMDNDFFDKHFVVLPVHEFENFFLDEKVIIQKVNEFLALTKKEEKEEDSILKVMKKYADDSLNDTKKKYLNNAIRDEMKAMADLIKQKDIVISSQADYNAYINMIIEGAEYEKRLQKIREKYSTMTDRYGVLNWTGQWKIVCDGKRVYRQSISEIAKEIGISDQNLNNMVFDAQLTDNESTICIFWKEICEKLK
ncbi:AAA family ATPase [Anaerocolumna sp. AGMB13025]|uniref:AAA family ATPase n=1 Tax=Anaerocolumna sp. AGMB13025 TaxID=3039116 RepID=UPI0024203425|nr:AAA family ATPase [Anaerocolumna sp. AGMB13025]WFR55638.1 AAA family ATPase [Anaerocolumna sp. AGMB13025]